MHPWERMMEAVVEHDFEKDWTPSELPAARKMGHVKAHHPVLKLSSYVEKEVALPARVLRAQAPGSDAWLNDQISDCGEGMALNGIQTFHAEAGTPIPDFVDEDAEYLYEEVGDYNPDAPLVDGQNPTDQGTDNDKLVAYWQDPGVLCAADGTRHTISESLFVDTTEYMTKLAIWEFVVNFRAYGLPAFAEQQRHWVIDPDASEADSEVGSWGYHDVAQENYGPYNIGLKTWGLRWMAQWAFDLKYAVQGFVVVTEEQENLQGLSPAGINWTRLNQDIADLRASRNQGS